MDRKKILLVDDHEVVRIGLKALVNREPTMEVVGEAANAPDAVAQAEELRPDVILMDIRLGKTSGIDACQEITKQLPETKVIMLTSYAEDEMLFAAIRTGAAGYVLKQAGGQAVIRAIHAALGGNTLLDPGAAESVVSAVRRAARAQGGGPFGVLSGQEQRVLARIATGDTNREIAMRLHLGEGTIRNYVSNILEKLHVANRAEAAAYAGKNNLRELLDLE
jgi:two-component system response regulator DevR